MGLSWKDLIATVLAIVIGTIYYAKDKGLDWPMIGSNRLSVLIVGVLGMVMCATGAKILNGRFTDGPILTTMTVLGAISFVLIIIGVITGNKTIYITLTALTLLLWLASTIRHIFVK